MSVGKVVIGDAELYCGDCRDVLPTLGKVDALVTDPPYGIALSNHGAKAGRRPGSFHVEGDADQEVGLWVLRQTSSIRTAVVFASPKAPWPGEWGSYVAWDKGGAVGGGGDTKSTVKRTWELIQIRRSKRFSCKRPEGVWRFTMTPRDTREHICAKPVPLMERLAETFTEGTVLDPFMGNGTTGVACVNLGRKFIGVEKERKYFDIACRRIQEAWEAHPCFL